MRIYKIERGARSRALNFSRICAKAGLNSSHDLKPEQWNQMTLIEMILQEELPHAIMEGRSLLQPLAHRFNVALKKTRKSKTFGGK
jgi:hypothetical protein